MITFLYTLAIRLYQAAIRLAAFWNDKARLWIKGRQSIWSQLDHFEREAGKEHPTIWMHCASLGEFEQGRPVLEALRKSFPSAKLVLSFFSPSGYEIRKTYQGVDLVCYMPVDLPANANRFVQALKPDLAIFVKYEFWYHHLLALQKANVPTLLISAIFRPNQLFFKPYGFWYRRLLYFFDHLFLQDEQSVALLNQIGFHQHSLAGDTRVDRVLDLQDQAPRFPLVEQFIGDAPVWIAGSTWPVDEQLLLPFWKAQVPQNWRIILAPHEIGETHITQIEDLAPESCIRYSELAKTQKNKAAFRLLIIDNIGMLNALYQYGRIAYIGGGFGKAIHNLLEPIAFRLPVIFGPKHEKFQEALELKQKGGGFAIENERDLLQVFDHLQEEENYQMASQKAFDYLNRSKGSTRQIVSYIHQVLVPGTGHPAPGT